MKDGPVLMLTLQEEVTRLTRELAQASTQLDAARSLAERYYDAEFARAGLQEKVTRLARELVMATTGLASAATTPERRDTRLATLARAVIDAFGTNTCSAKEHVPCPSCGRCPVT
jgi:hypothetical protein